MPEETTEPISAQALEVLEIRVGRAAETLRTELSRKCTPEVMNAAIGEWLDAVYAARLPFYERYENEMNALADDNEDVGLVVGLVHARNESTHHWVYSTSHGMSVPVTFPVTFRRWHWIASSYDASTRKYYDQYLNDEYVGDCVDPAVEVLTEILPNHDFSTK